MKRVASALSLAALHLAAWHTLTVAQESARPPAQAQAPAAAARSADPKAAAKAFARRIDQIINARLAEAQLKAAPQAPAALIARRLHLDLIGRIPDLLEIRDFLENDDPAKYEMHVEKLLASEDYARHFAHVWRSIMLQGTNNAQFRGLEPQFEIWLKARLQSNTPYDKLAHEVITAGQGGTNYSPTGGTPQAFYVVNENKPENLAGATSRVFLGVKIECAQCHAHPFAKWTRNQFWEYAAFFANVQRNPRVRGGLQPVANGLGREIKIPGTEKVVKARFLDGTEPQWQAGLPSNRILADWVVSPGNPYFAKAAVDHVWSYFFGVSLVEPILEPNDDSPLAHPELLNLLAKEFTASGFDLKYLIRAIVHTDAYRRVSASPQVHRDEINLFARMPVRGMSPEQLFDSLCEATDHVDPYANQPQFRQVQGNGQPVTPRQAYLARFTSQDRRIETHTSILQALFMMNGKFLAERTTLSKNKSLFTIATAPTSTARRVETLYLLVLSRLPRAEEAARLAAYIERHGTAGDRQQAVANVYWALLNSAEFMLNH